jgi:hypothetical protein
VRVLAVEFGDPDIFVTGNGYADGHRGGGNSGGRARICDPLSDDRGRTRG